MPALGRHCAEIMEGRHPDVLEMDAASNTGVDNIREIIESARYKPLVARYKVYIIDEVHMLSKGAFNALLKTLEEPPEHVKFIFATTEIRKVPVTVLSRCQRFDLRRVDVPVLIAALPQDRRQRRRDGRGRRAGADRARGRGLGARRPVAARPGDRHGLRARSRPTSVRAMLGLADRGRIFDLLEQRVRAATPAAALRRSRPASRRRRAAAGARRPRRGRARAPRAQGRSAPRPRARALGARRSAAPPRSASGLSMPLLARAWQMLLKGLEEAAQGAQPAAPPPRWC